MSSEILPPEDISPFFKSFRHYDLTQSAYLNDAWLYYCAPLPENGRQLHISAAKTISASRKIFEILIDMPDARGSVTATHFMLQENGKRSTQLRTIARPILIDDNLGYLDDFESWARNMPVDERSERAIVVERLVDMTVSLINYQSTCLKQQIANEGMEFNVFER